MKITFGLLIGLLGTACSCSSNETVRDDGGGGGNDNGSLVPLIGEVLDCGKKSSVGGLANSVDSWALQRYELDQQTFPDALCNDGTSAVIYFRPYSGDENKHRWLLQLQGGGGCYDGQSCADRWCGKGSPLAMTHMTSHGTTADGGTVDAPDAIPPKGILARADANERGGDTYASYPNPLGGYNQLYLRACTGDNWAGDRRDAVYDASHPVTGKPVTYRMHFLGSRVLDAVLDTLRRNNGAAAMTYTMDKSGRVLPDLDEAVELVVAGASVGSGGVINNVDRVASSLRAANPTLQVRAIVDSNFVPALAKLDYSTTTYCKDAKLCTYGEFWEHEYEVGALAERKSRLDESCLAHYQTSAPQDSWRCADLGGVVRNHLTTPFFVRMSTRDEKHIQESADVGFSVVGKGPLDANLFSALVASELAELADIKKTAIEGAAITVVPGVFSPTCDKHETLSNTCHVYGVAIGAADRMFDVWTRWQAGQSASVIETDAAKVTCPKDDCGEKL